MLHRRTGTGEGSLSARPTGPPPNRASAPTANASYTPLKRRESANLYGQPSGSPAFPQTPTYGNDAKARYAVPSPSPNGAAGGGAGSYMDAKAYKRSSLTVVPGLAPTYGYGFPNDGGRGSLDLGDTYDTGVEDGPLPERLAKGVKLAFTHLRKGLEDSARLDRSWSLVWGDPELRKVVLKSS